MSVITDQQLQNEFPLSNDIYHLMRKCNLTNDCFWKLVDYTVELFQKNELGSNYYGYHNLEHEMEVTYFTLLAAHNLLPTGFIKEEDIKYLFVASLFHDFDPEKNVDKPHEDAVIKFLKTDEKLSRLLKEADLDINLIIALIHRTTYPWIGKKRELAEKEIDECLNDSDKTKKSNESKKHFKELGWFLSCADRISGYALGDFSRGMELAKKNAHALAWHQKLIVRRAVAYFEDLLNNETEMYERIMFAVPKYMRQNFMDNVQSFMKLREKEIEVEAQIVSEKIKLVPTIDTLRTRQSKEFIRDLYEIYKELPTPLQFKKGVFAESVKNPSTILNTLRMDSPDGPIIGYAKGGPLESYRLNGMVDDENYGKYNSIFLEPLTLKAGYWGHNGGREMRLLFTLQAQSKRYKYLTSFALRDVIQNRIGRAREELEFVKKFDPQRWDYFRVKI